MSKVVYNCIKCGHHTSKIIVNPDSDITIFECSECNCQQYFNADLKEWKSK